MTPEEKRKIEKEVSGKLLNILKFYKVPPTTGVINSLLDAFIEGVDYMYREIRK